MKTKKITYKRISLSTLSENSDLSINGEAMETMERMNTKDSIEKES